MEPSEEPVRFKPANMFTAKDIAEISTVAAINSCENTQVDYRDIYHMAEEGGRDGELGYFVRAKIFVPIKSLTWCPEELK